MKALILISCLLALPACADEEVDKGLLAREKDVIFVQHMAETDQKEAAESIRYNLGVDDDVANAILAYCQVARYSLSKAAASEGLYAATPIASREKLRKWIGEMIDFGSETIVVITKPEAK